jgi:Kef-type K+ transport system membrane component KefB
MPSFLQLALLLTILLFTAKAAGYLSTRIKQPSVFGEILVGILLGPSLLNVMQLPFVTDSHLHEVVDLMGELGVLFLMFLAGLELHINDLVKNARVAAYAGVLGVILPVGLGLGFGELTGMDFNHGLFLGLTLGATSVSISAQVLIELKMIRSKIGYGLLGAAVFDDVLVLLLLSVFLAFLTGGTSLVGVLLVIGKMLLFLGASTAIGMWVLPLLVRFTQKRSISQGITTLAIVVMLLYAVAAELLGGMAAITGAFLCGLMFARTPEKTRIETNFHSLAYALFVPIFFVSIGLGVNLKTVDVTILWIMLAISGIAILGKIIGSGGGARLSHFSWRESLQIGIGMVSRGEVGLIIAKIGMDGGYLSDSLFNAIVGMILVTTLITPPLLRLSFRSKNPNPIIPDIPQIEINKENL